MKLALPFAFACVACASATPQASRGFHAGAEPPRLGVVVEDHLGWPYRLERLLVVLDGSVIHDSRAPEGPVIEVAELSGVPLGDHTLQVLAKVAYASGSFDDECTATLRTARAFTITGRSTSVRLDLYASDVTRPFGERVRADTRVMGYYGESVSGCE